jgi:hypothetical protein
MARRTEGREVMFKSVKYFLHDYGFATKQAWEELNQAEAELTQLRAEVERLKVLAEIGEAVEKAFDKGAFVVYDVVWDSVGNIVNYNSDSDMADLLLWNKEGESND